MTEPMRFLGDPELFEGPRTFPVEIGFAHHFEGEKPNEKLVLERDKDGKPIPTVYHLPVRVTVQQVRVAAKRFKSDLRQTGEEVLPGWDMWIVLLNSVVGGDFCLKVFTDPTVEIRHAMDVVVRLTSYYGLAATLGHMGVAELGEALPLDRAESTS